VSPSTTWLSSSGCAGSLLRRGLLSFVVLLFVLMELLLFVLVVVVVLALPLFGVLCVSAVMLGDCM
jgi:hypothetical protein